MYYGSGGVISKRRVKLNDESFSFRVSYEVILNTDGEIFVGFCDNSGSLSFPNIPHECEVFSKPKWGLVVSNKGIAKATFDLPSLPSITQGNEGKEEDCNGVMEVHYSGEEGVISFWGGALLEGFEVDLGKRDEFYHIYVGIRNISSATLLPSSPPIFSFSSTPPPPLTCLGRECTFCEEEGMTDKKAVFVVGPAFGGREEILSSLNLPTISHSQVSNNSN